jgi:hypothetical protein
MKHHAFTFIASITLLCSLSLAGQTVIIPENGKLFINPDYGQDNAQGTKELPLKTLVEAAQRINRANGKGAIDVILAPGIYGLDATATFHPVNWHFTKEQRLTIRAEYLPDDKEWHPGKMPVIICTMPLDFKPYGNDDPLGGASYGIQIETSHVTIQGLRVMGTPVVERPKVGLVRRAYPIVREGKHLDDLRVTQCLFVGDEHVIPNHLAVLASGQGIVVDHCVFYKCKDAVVYWRSNEPSKNCAMHHNLLIDNYGGGVWAWTVDDDFKFYNNVISNINVFWEANDEDNRVYTLSNSVVVGYNSLVNSGGGAFGYGEPVNPGKVKFGDDVIVKKEGRLEIIEDPTDRYYLHLKPGTLGSDLGAGLFYNKN